MRNVGVMQGNCTVGARTLRALAALAVSLFGLAAHTAPVEVKVSEFGFDAKDSTRFLQAALDSGAAKVVVDDRGGPWMSGRLYVRSNQTILLERGVELLALPESSGESDGALICMSGSSNVVVLGECDAKIGGRVSINAASNVMLHSLTLEATGRTVVSVSNSDNVRLVSSVARQGQSDCVEISGSRRFLALDCLFEGSRSGAGLRLGLSGAQNCLHNCVFAGNAGPGVLIDPARTCKTPEDPSVEFRNCHAVANRTGLAVSGRGSSEGCIVFEGCTFAGNADDALALPPRTLDGVEIDLRNCTYGGCATPVHTIRVLDVLPDEYWWGPEVGQGWRMPLSARSSYLTDLRASHHGNQAAPLLLSSKGRYVWCEDPFLFAVADGKLILVSDGAPFECVTAGTSIREAFRAARSRHFPPKGMPREEFFTAPMLCTWIELQYNQNEKDVLAYARSFLDRGVRPGVFLIDCTWQNDSYGFWTFHEGRFRDPKAMVARMREMGYHVILWMAPFITADNIHYRRLRDGKALVGSGNPDRYYEDYDPALVRWWDGKSAILDFSCPAANDWFRQTLKRLMSDYGVEGFFFDAGDVQHQEFDFRYFNPKSNASEQCRGLAKFGLEVPFQQHRACWKLGGEPLMQTLRDKEPKWSEMRRCVSDMIAAGQLGYPFIAADLVGGGDYVHFAPGVKFNYEIFIRHLQIECLSPILQFSGSPWRVLEEKYQRIVLDMLKLREKWTPYILGCARDCGRTGEPMLRSLDYAYPGCGYETVTDEFLLGDRLLVAPVVDGGVVSRRVTIPAGTWVSDRGETVTGPTAIEVETPLERLPHFERVADPAGDVGFHAKERRAFTGVPAIAVSKSGERLWMTWYAGITNGEDSNNYCVLSTSTDGGASWKEVLYADPDGPGPSRAFDPQVWVAPDGRLRWFWCQRDDVPVRTSEKNRFFPLEEEHRQAAGDRIMMAELSADVEPAEMPESRCIGSGVLACKPIITRAGRWLLPNARWGNGTSARLIESCDGGRTFAEIGGASLPAGIREYDEHSVVELKDGRLRLYMRTRKGPNALWFSESSDGGRTWSASRPCAFCSTNARQCVRRLRDGSLLMVKNGPLDADVGRKRMTYFLSDDDGLTWREKGVLREGEPCAYPDCDQAPDGTVYVVFDGDRFAKKEINFRKFGVGAPALSGGAGAQPESQEEPSARFGVLADIHIDQRHFSEPGGGRSVEVFRKALICLGARAVDGVVVAGDITQDGAISELKRFHETWQSVFPDDRRPDGGRVERLFVFGDHDVEKPFCYLKFWPEGLKDPKIAADLTTNHIAFIDRAKVWKDVFREDFAPIVRKTVKGYDFVLAHLVNLDEDGMRYADPLHIPGLEEFFSTNSFDRVKPFFYVQHKIPRGTVGGRYQTGQDSGRTTAILSRYSNAVGFNGHKHRMATEELSLWQGAFTQVQAPGLATLLTAAGRENSRCSCEAPCSTPAQQMDSVDSFNGSHALVVSVYGDRLVIERIDVLHDGEPVAEPWVVRWPNDGSSAYEARGTAAGVPQFAAGTKVSVAKRFGRDRAGVATNQVVVSFPPTCSPRAYDYEVTALLSKGAVSRVVSQKRVYSPRCYCPERYDTNDVICVFGQPEISDNHESVKFVVRPMNAWGKAGEPIESESVECWPKAPLYPY